MRLETVWLFRRNMCCPFVLKRWLGGGPLGQVDLSSMLAYRESIAVVTSDDFV